MTLLLLARRLEGHGHVLDPVVRAGEEAAKVATAAIEDRRRDGLSIARNVREGTRREQFVGFSTVVFRDHFIRQDFRRAINAARHAEVDGVIDQKTPWFVEANLFSSYGAQI